MTISTQDYALMAANAYRLGATDDTLIPIPGGWQQLSGPLGYTTERSGFEAVAYQKGSEIVISFAGTQDLIDWATNFALGIGLGAIDQQLMAAAVFYEAIKTEQKVPTKGTGHLSEANWLIFLETDFHSSGAAGRRGPS